MKKYLLLCICLFALTTAAFVYNGPGYAEVLLQPDVNIDALVAQLKAAGITIKTAGYNYPGFSKALGGGVNARSSPMDEPNAWRAHGWQRAGEIADLFGLNEADRALIAANAGCYRACAPLNFTRLELEGEYAALLKVQTMPGVKAAGVMPLPFLRIAYWLSNHQPRLPVQSFGYRITPGQSRGHLAAIVNLFSSCVGIQKPVY